jgi:hypothetical protein
VSESPRTPEQDHAAHVAEVESQHPQFGAFLRRATENPVTREAYYAASRSNGDAMNDRALEARIVRARAPRCVRLHRLRRYRWQVTTYRPTAPTYPGVFDGRLHMHDDHGYTFTRWGAYRALGRVVYRPGKVHPE